MRGRPRHLQTLHFFTFGRHVLFCDNEAALAALIAYKSDSPLVTAQLAELCNLEVALDLNIWFERVPALQILLPSHLAGSLLDWMPHPGFGGPRKTLHSSLRALSGGFLSTSPAGILAGQTLACWTTTFAVWA